MKYKVVLLATVLFSLFIAWVIYLADSGQKCFFFDLVKRIPSGDKIGHFFLFGLLTLGTNIVFRLRGVRLGVLTVPYGAILILTVVVIEEFSQHFIATRTMDISDIMADMVGIVAFSLITSGHYPRQFWDVKNG